MVIADGTRTEGHRRHDAPPTPARSGSPVVAWLESVHARHAGVDEGAVATYIPELARADPAWFGIAVATVDGSVHEVGDSGVAFTIQSISKPLTYGLALEALGEEAVRRRIGVEPTGEAFNSIALAPGSGIPLNAMVNAGAIAAAALLAGAGDRSGPAEAERWVGLLRDFGRFAGRDLVLDERVYRSERDTGHRNRAIGHLLRASGAMDGDPDRAVDLYFRQCSAAVTARDLAVIAATLAAGGRNPVTGEVILSQATTRSVLSVMASCGMYDGAGEWLFSVGLPAKSGVAGGLIAVLPGQFGIGIFSPPLDEHGNSVRAVRVCRDLSRELGLHLMSGRTADPSPIRSRYTLAEIGSKRRRGEPERAHLAALGSGSVVLELQGALAALAVERISAALLPPDPDRRHVVLDLRRVGAVEPSGLRLLAHLAADLQATSVEVVVSGAGPREIGFDAAQAAIAAVGARRLTTFEELDLALEWLEDRLLAGADDGPGQGAVALAGHALLAGLDAARLERVEDLLTTRAYPPGQEIVRAGEPAAELFLVASGRLSVSVALEGGGRRRLTTLGPGMMFGEGALLGAGRRSADVRADDEVICHVLNVGDFEGLLRDEPTIGTAILRNLAGIIGETARRLTAELAIIAG